jgi:hypothetical protein
MGSGAVHAGYVAPLIPCHRASLMWQLQLLYQLHTVRSGRVSFDPGAGGADYGPNVTDAPLQPHPGAPWPTLAERESGLLPPPEYYEDVPAHMDRPLRSWVARVIGDQRVLARRVVTRLRVSSSVTSAKGPATDIEIVNWLVAGEAGYYDVARLVDRLTVVDAIVAMHPAWERDPQTFSQSDQEAWAGHLLALQQLLADCGSAWTVDFDFRGLYRRVEAPVVEAWQRARAAAEESGRQSAARYLTEAWKKIYGMHPEPTDGYTAAVKAVEAVAVPVVLPSNPRAIVHHVRRELKAHPSHWRFIIGEAEGVQAGEGAIDVVTTMLDRLLRGETERHGVEGVNRPSTPAEAQAAVHLAAVLVQWFISGAVQPRVTS